MSDNSRIEWTDATWNPVVGCSIVSPGCTNCYAMGEAARQIRCAAGLGRETHYAGTATTVKGKPVWTGKLALAPDSILLQPLKRKKPTTYFVNSMGDLFHEDAPDEWIDKVFAVMALAPRHTFQILTKRANRMRDYFSDLRTRGTEIAQASLAMGIWIDPEFQGQAMLAMEYNQKPLPNVWLGVSTERQQEADERIPLLRATPAAVRFISAEPLLGPIDLGEHLRAYACHDCFNGRTRVNGHFFDERCPACGGTGAEKSRLDWVICGGESGPGARPMHPDWARSLRDQCAAAGVSFFFKQWGQFLPWSQFNGAAVEDDPEQTRFATLEWEDDRWNDVGRPMWCDSADGNIDDEQCVGMVGKKRAGRLLDGIEHNDMPVKSI